MSDQSGQQQASHQARASLFQPQWQGQAQAQPSQQGGSWMLNVLTNIHRAQQQQRGAQPGVAGPAQPLHPATQASEAASQLPASQAPVQTSAAVGGQESEGLAKAVPNPQGVAPAAAGKKRGRPKGSKNKPKANEEGRLPPYLPLEALGQQPAIVAQLQLPASSQPFSAENATSVASQEQQQAPAAAPPTATASAAGRQEDTQALPGEAESLNTHGFTSPSETSPLEEELPPKRKRGKPKGRHLDDHIALEDPDEDLDKADGS